MEDGGWRVEDGFPPRTPIAACRCLNKGSCYQSPLHGPLSPSVPCYAAVLRPPCHARPRFFQCLDLDGQAFQDARRGTGQGEAGPRLAFRAR